MYGLHKIIINLPLQVEQQQLQIHKGSLQQVGKLHEQQ